MQDLTGQTLGQYRIVEPVGRGGMASVFKAFQPSLERYVAIKVLPPYYMHEEGFAERFAREARAVARLEHPHILPVYDFGQEGEYTYIVMKYVPAGTLKDVVVAGPMDTERAAEIVEHLAEALDHAHEQGIIHRDVKPSNVLMDRGTWALLMDFGLAKMVEGSVQLTASGVGVGTPAYMAPEQGQGKTIDHRADVYSLGVVLYEMLTGRVPFDAETPMAVVIKHITEPLPMPRTVNPTIPEEIELVILKALAKDPQDRYQTCGEMAASLQSALGRQSGVFTDAFAVDEAAPFPLEPLEAVPQEPVVAAPPAPQPIQQAVAETSVQAPVPAPEPETAPPAPQAAQMPKTTPPHPQTTPRAAAAAAQVPAPRAKAIPWWAFAGGAVVLLAVVAVVVLAAAGVFSPDDEPYRPESDLVLDIEPPEGAVRVAPCGWDGLGDGLCIHSLIEERAPAKILVDAGFQHIDGASWRPDGRQLVVSGVHPDAGADAEAALYIVNADGSGLSQITHNENSIAASWSPDGEWIVFHRNCDLARIHPDGSEIDVIWVADGRCVIDPQWSPDGEWIVFSVSPNPDWTFPMEREIYVIARDGDDLTRVAATTHGDEEHLWAEVAFSPDGARVVYFDGENRAHLVYLESPDEVMPVEDFPYMWLSSHYPQWEE